MGYRKEELRAMLMQAQAIAGSSRAQKALPILECAIDRAATLGSPPWLRRTFAVSGALTGNASHAQAAEALLHDLRRQLTDALDAGVSQLIGFDLPRVSA